MKAFFLTGSIILTAFILILAFENLGATLQYFSVLFVSISSGFMAVLGLSVIGIFAGIFYTGLVLSLIKGKGEDEEAPGAEW